MAVAVAVPVPVAVAVAVVAIVRVVDGITAVKVRVARQLTILIISLARAVVRIAVSATGTTGTTGTTEAAST
jgi:hypothetical protein